MNLFQLLKNTASSLALFLLLTCQSEQPHPYTFYYWRTNLSLSYIENQELQKATSPYLYTRFFDIEKVNNRFQPVALLTKDESFSSEKPIVPVIFIRNDALLNITAQEIEFLAKSIHQAIESNAADLQLNIAPEIQLDCDWTAGTRNDFFALIQVLEQVSNKNITSTLRLHQVRDRDKMGVPPVNKVYLMCYATSSPLENSPRNSILDLQLLKNYLGDLQHYPIQNISVALPLYSWGIVTNHLGKHRLINGLTQKDLQKPEFEKLSDHEVEVKEDGFYFGNYLNKGFRIRTEEITEKTLDDATDFLNTKLSEFEIVYYQLDQKFVENQKLQR